MASDKSFELIQNQPTKLNIPKNLGYSQDGQFLAYSDMLGIMHHVLKL